jgi:hypothetical protein
MTKLGVWRKLEYAVSPGKVLAAAQGAPDNQVRIDFCNLIGLVHQIATAKAGYPGIPESLLPVWIKDIGEIRGTTDNLSCQDAPSLAYVQSDVVSDLFTISLHNLSPPHVVKVKTDLCRADAPLFTGGSIIAGTKDRLIIGYGLVQMDNFEFPYRILAPAFE